MTDTTLTEIEDDLATQHDEAELSIFPTLEDRKLFLTTLKLLGITEVEVSFQGGGDCGEIDGIGACDATGKTINIEDVMYPQGWQRRSDFDVESKAWKESTTRGERKLVDMLESLTYDALEKSGHDWYNNDGGQGSLKIDFRESPPLIKLEVGINYTNTDDYEYQL